MQIMIITTVLTVFMFAIVFVKNINKEDVAPIIINLLFFLMMVYVWFIAKDINMIEFKEGIMHKYFFNVIHIFMIAITTVQLVINIMLFFLKKIEKREKRKKEVE